MSDEDVTFETADGGASLVYPQEAGACRKNGHVMLKGCPCKIVEISVSKTGKHGHAKCAFVGVDIFTGKKKEDMCPSTHNMEIPNVARVEFTLLDMNQEDGTVSVLKENGDTKDDLNLPDQTDDDKDNVTKMQAAFDEGKSLVVTVLCAMGQEKIVAFKEIS